MKNVAVVGSQWGDEGKGKIVDWLSSEADIVVRFQGGHNAGAYASDRRYYLQVKTSTIRNSKKRQNFNNWKWRGG